MMICCFRIITPTKKKGHPEDSWDFEARKAPPLMISTMNQETPTTREEGVIPNSWDCGVKLFGGKTLYYYKKKFK